VTIAPLGTFDLYEFSFSASSPVSVGGGSGGAGAGRAQFGELTLLVRNDVAFAPFMSFDAVAGTYTVGPPPTTTQVSVRLQSQAVPFLTGTQAVVISGFAHRPRTSASGPELVRLTLTLGAATLMLGGNLAGWSVMLNSNTTGFMPPPLMGPSTCTTSGTGSVSLVTQLPPATAPSDGGILLDDGLYAGDTSVTFMGTTAIPGRLVYTDAVFTGPMDANSVCLFRDLVTGRQLRLTNTRQSAAGFVSKVTSQRAFVSSLAYQSTPTGTIRQRVAVSLGDATVSFTP
jgi:hypothetical protein